MGMTIDEAMLNLHAIQDYYNDLGFDRKDNESVEVAIDTMRKYQMIQEIMAKRPKDMISSNPTLRAISEVIEDGKVD